MFVFEKDFSLTSEKSPLDFTLSYVQLKKTEPRWVKGDKYVQSISYFVAI